MDIPRCDYFLAFSGGTGIPSWEQSLSLFRPSLVAWMAQYGCFPTAGARHFDRADLRCH